MTDQPDTGLVFATWLQRLGALLVDFVPVIALSVVLFALFGENEVSDNGASFQLNGWPALVHFAATLGWFVYNWLIKQGKTGSTMGKKAVGLGIFKTGTTKPLGPGLTFARQLAHIADGLPCLLGYFWPLWDKENRTFADMMVDSRAYKV